MVRAGTHCVGPFYALNLEIMNRKSILFASVSVIMLAMSEANAQKSGFSYNFYGSVRNDVFYSTRQNQMSEEGSFYLFPQDKKYDTVFKTRNGADGNHGLIGKFFSGHRIRNTILQGRISMPVVISTFIICVPALG